MPLTDQELFDAVSTHLLKQGWQSTAEVGCAYRGKHGMSCAIGCLIPDDVYSPGFEGKMVPTVRLREDHPHKDYPWYAHQRKFEAAIGAISDNLMLMRELQKVHDTPLNTEDRKYPELLLEKISQWPKELMAVASLWNLDDSIPRLALEAGWKPTPPEAVMAVPQ